MTRIQLIDRRLFWIRGPDALAFLDRILTQSFPFGPASLDLTETRHETQKLDAAFRAANASSGEQSGAPDAERRQPILATQCRYGALLTPQGRLLGDLFVVRPRHVAGGGSNERGLLLDIASLFADALIGEMLRYRLRARIEILPAPEYRVSWTQADKGSGSARDPRPFMGWRDYEIGTETQTIPGVDHVGQDRSIFADLCRDDVTSLIPWWSQRDHAPAPNHDVKTHELSVYHRMRIGSGIADPAYDSRMGADFASDLNLDLLHAIDYQKGCFIGQEVASRMKRKSDMKRRALRVTLSEPPRFPLIYGADVLADGQLLGTLRQGIGSEGIAVIRLDRLEEARANRQSIRITIAGMPDIACEIAPLPSFDEGPSA